MTNTKTIEAAIPRHSSGLLMNLVIVLLAPVFLAVTGGDVDLARMAAREAVNDYRAHNNADLAVAQIIAFGLAALGSLSLSMADEISLSMTLRLRGNAIACNRSAEQNRRALTTSQADHAAPHPTEELAGPEPTYDGDTDVDMFLSATAAQELTTESDARLQSSKESEEATPAPTVAPTIASEKRHHAMWAIAMVKESGEISASLPRLPPAEREAATMRAALLSTTAHDLLYGSPQSPLSPGSLAGITPPTLGNSARP